LQRRKKRAYQTKYYNHVVSVTETEEQQCKGRHHHHHVHGQESHEEYSCAVVAKFLESHFQNGKTHLSVELHQSSSVFVKTLHLEPLAPSSLFPSIPELVDLVSHYDQFPVRADSRKQIII
jgi:hypothetical protein